MKKFLVAGVLGAIVMVTAGTQAATAAGWGGYRGHFNAHPVSRTAFVRPHFYNHFYGPGYNRCW